MNIIRDRCQEGRLWEEDWPNERRLDPMRERLDHQVGTKKTSQRRVFLVDKK